MTTKLPVTLGRTQAGGDLRVDLAAAWHTAIQGATRGGKSVLTYRLLGGVANRDCVVIAGLDPTGILFAPWRWSPHPEWRWMGPRNPLDAVAVTAALVAEMDDRIDGLKQSFTDKIEDFDRDCPVIIVVFEEYPGMLEKADEDDATNGRKPAERIKPRIQAAMGRLVREGAKVGVRVVILAQRMDAAFVPGSVRDNLGLRITLRQEGSDGIRMLHEGQVPPDEMASFARFQPGQGVYQHPEFGFGFFRTDVTDYRQYVDRVLRFHPQPTKADEQQ